MASTAKPRSRSKAKPRAPRFGAAALVGFFARNPTLTGGATAFLVALSYVSANAIWYQPFAHKGAFFATRAMPVFDNALPQEVDGTTFLIERPEQAAATPKGDPVIEQVQRILSGLNFYAGDIDGLEGPNTRRAIEAYQARVGLAITGVADDALLDQLGAAPAAASAPAPKPRAAVAQTADLATGAVPPARQPDERIVKIQAGLKAFGNQDVEIDGVLGTRTRTAIREFQALFGLPETSEPDDAVFAKMREVGFVD